MTFNSVRFEAVDVEFTGRRRRCPTGTVPACADVDLPVRYGGNRAQHSFLL
jgi:hypothetical protein